MFKTDFNKDTRKKRIVFEVDGKFASVICYIRDIKDEHDEEYARFKFDFENKEVILSGIIRDESEYLLAMYWDFGELMNLRENTIKPGDKEFSKIILTAMTDNSYFKQIADECDLLTISKNGLNFTVIWLFEYLKFKSFKTLTTQPLGRYLLESFIMEKRCYLPRVNECFADFFKDGETLYEILGITPENNMMFDRYLNRFSTFYNDWYISRLKANNFISYFYQ